jgi:hypothetical protein
MPANGPIHDVIPQIYTAWCRTAHLRDITSRRDTVLIPHAANISQRPQQLAPAKPDLLSRNCAIRGFGVRETLR